MKSKEGQVETKWARHSLSDYCVRCQNVRDKREKLRVASCWSLVKRSIVHCAFSLLATSHYPLITCGFAALWITLFCHRSTLPQFFYASFGFPDIELRAMSWQHVEHISDVTERVPTVLAIGNFDGVHLGHQAVLKSVVESAHAIGARPAALTFFPHPREVIRGDMSPYYLMPLADRVAKLAENGIELVITHPFNETVRHTRAAEFVRQMVDYLDLRQLWGGNFSLGYKREGDFAFLSEQGAKHGFTVHLFGSVELPMIESIEGVDSQTISSSRIRRSLRAGNVREAARCLGHPYTVHGPVLLGKQLGRTIGIPTANVGVWERQLLPAYGVYATRVWVDGEPFIGATNVGVRPTVDGSTHVTVEPHILDFNRDIYDQEVTVEFIERVRDEQKFNGLDALKAQIHHDINTIRQIMQSEPT